MNEKIRAWWRRWGRHTQIPAATILLLVLSNPAWPVSLSRFVSLPLIALTSAIVLLSGSVSVARPRVPWLVVPLLAWLTVSAVWSDSPSQTIKAVASMAVVVASAAIVVAVLSPRVLAITLIIFAAAALLLSLLAALIAPSVALVAGDYQGGALQGIYPHRNILAYVVLWGVVGVLAFPTMTRRNTLVKFAAAAAAVAVVFFITRSSTGLVAGVAVFVLALILWGLRSIPDQRRRIATIGAVAVALLALAFVYLNSAFFLGLLGRDSTLTNRTLIWEVVIDTVSPRLWLGFGWEAVWDLGSPAGDAIRREIQWTFFHAHNGYLDVLVQVGLVGAVLFALTLLSIWALTTWRHLARVFPGALWGSLVIGYLLVYSLTETRATQPLGFWLVTAAAVIALRELPGRGRVAADPDLAEATATEADGSAPRRSR